MKKNTINSLLKSNSKQGPAPAPAPIRTQVAPPVVSASFWLHKFFTGKDPIRYLEESWKKPEKKYFVVNANSIYYGKNQLTNAIIEETIDLRDLYDREVDSAAEGRCCERLKYVEYPEVKMCDGSPCNKLYPGGKITNEQKDNDPFLARFCVLLYSYNIVNWRICHWNKNEIQRLRMNIITQVVKLEVPVIDPSVMQKILMNAKYSPLQEQESWSWMDQDKWEGNCQSQIMQSPIPIKVEPNAPSIQPRFMFSFSFANNIPYEVVKHKEEIRIVFTSKPNENGSLRMEFGTYELMVKNFFPYQIVFRFPAEHTLNDNRYDGEIVLQFIENIDNNDKKMALLNGFNWVVPIRFDPDAKLIKELEQLMPDFWKFELETRKKYVPKDIKTGKRQTFDLGYFFDRFNSKDDEKKSTDYAIYLGSETTPPCKDFVFYIVNFLPLNIPNCQFKIFRENSLLTHRDRETHARLLRENTKSGPPEIRRVLKADVVPKPPAPPVPAPPVKPKIINGVEVTYVGQKTEPPAEPNHVPNCELKRDMN